MTDAHLWKQQNDAFRNWLRMSCGNYGAKDFLSQQRAKRVVRVAKIMAAPVGWTGAAEASGEASTN